MHDHHDAGATNVPVGVFATADAPFNAFSANVDFEGEFLDIMEVTIDGTQSEGAGFFVTLSNNDPGPEGSWWHAAIVIGFDPEDYLPPDTEHLIVLALYGVEPDAPVDTAYQAAFHFLVALRHLSVDLELNGAVCASPARNPGRARLP